MVFSLLCTLPTLSNRSDQNLSNVNVFFVYLFLLCSNHLHSIISDLLLSLFILLLLILLFLLVDHLFVFLFLFLFGVLWGFLIMLFLNVWKMYICSFSLCKCNLCSYYTALLIVSTACDIPINIFATHLCFLYLLFLFNIVLFILLTQFYSFNSLFQALFFLFLFPHIHKQTHTHSFTQTKPTPISHQTQM